MRCALREWTNLFGAGASPRCGACASLVGLVLLIALPVGAESGSADSATGAHEEGQHEDGPAAEQESGAASGGSGNGYGAKAFDLVAVRPMTAVQTVVGFPFFLVAAADDGPDRRDRRGMGSIRPELLGLHRES